LTQAGGRPELGIAEQLHEPALPQPL